jgi:hypothetical protein
LVASAAPDSGDDWWVQLEDPDNVHCETTQGVTFEQVVSNAHRTFNAGNIFLFVNKRIVIVPHWGQPISENFNSPGSNSKGMIHTIHPVNWLLVDGPRYVHAPAFGRLYIYSKTLADCKITLAYAHYLLGF